MKFKKIVSAAAALTLSVTAFAGLAVTANAADPIYSNDFSSENLDNAVTWTAASKKPTGYSYAQIGRGGEMSLVDGSLNWTTSGEKTTVQYLMRHMVFSMRIYRQQQLRQIIK